jgi:flavin reductase (DIM6/NTAB) family NADH-FMN oxidoreductase RutF
MEFPVEVDERALREVMGRYITGVSIVTTVSPEGPLGTTVNSFTSVSLDPPTVLVCLNRQSRTYEPVMAAGCNAINILGGSQAELARRFANNRLSAEERFRWLELRRAITSSPLIADSAAWLDCRVREVFEVGTHGIVVGDVVAAGTDPSEEPPLANHERRMGPLR